MVVTIGTAVIAVIVIIVVGLLSIVVVFHSCDRMGRVRTSIAAVVIAVRIHVGGHVIVLIMKVITILLLLIRDRRPVAPS